MLRIIFAGVLSLGCSLATAAEHADILAAFQAASLPVAEPVKMGPEDYGMGPFVCVGQRFRLDTDRNGRLFRCDDQAEQAALADYYIETGKTNAVFFSWVFQHGPWLLQLNGELPEEQAKKFETVLQSAR